MKWEDGFAARIPHLGALQNAAHILALRMSAHLALGESAAALADWRDGLALYRAMEHEPVLLCGLVRVAILRVMEDVLAGGLAARQWAEPELRAVSADLASLNLLADMQFALASERGMMNGVFDSLAARGLFARSHDLQMLARLSAESPAPPALASFIFPTGWVRESQVKVNELYDQHLARLDLANGIINGGPSVDAQLVTLKESNTFVRFRYAFAALLMPALDGFTNKYATTHTNTQQVRVACALELFRRARGTFPERLDALVPEFLDAVPRDVMDGAPLRYRREGEGFALWSIGANRVDDGAKSDPAKNAREQPDWVWRP